MTRWQDIRDAVEEAAGFSLTEYQARRVGGILAAASSPALSKPESRTPPCPRCWDEPGGCGVCRSGRGRTLPTSADKPTQHYDGTVKDAWPAVPDPRNPSPHPPQTMKEKVRDRRAWGPTERRVRVDPPRLDYDDPSPPSEPDPEDLPDLGTCEECGGPADGPDDAERVQCDCGTTVCSSCCEAHDGESYCPDCARGLREQDAPSEPSPADPWALPGGRRWHALPDSSRCAIRNDGRVLFGSDTYDAGEWEACSGSPADEMRHVSKLIAIRNRLDPPQATEPGGAGDTRGEDDR